MTPFELSTDEQMAEFQARQLPDLAELFAPYVQRLRDIGLTGEFRIWAHLGVDWTLFSETLLDRRHGNKSFYKWHELESFVARRLAELEASKAIDLIALGM
jgi:hypothetical protein